MPTKLRQRRQQKALLSAQGKVDSGETLTNRENKALNLSLSQNKPTGTMPELDTGRGTYQGEKKFKMGVALDASRKVMRGMGYGSSSSNASTTKTSGGSKVDPDDISSIANETSSQAQTGTTDAWEFPKDTDSAKLYNKYDPNDKTFTDKADWDKNRNLAIDQLSPSAKPGGKGTSAPTVEATEALNKPTEANTSKSATDKETARLAHNTALHERLTKESQAAAGAGTEVKTPGIQNIQGELGTYNPTSQQYEGGTKDRSILSMKNQVDNARNPQHNVISSTGTNGFGNIESREPAKINTDPKTRDIQTLESSGGSTSTMPELDTGPGTYQGEQKATETAAALALDSAIGSGKNSDVSTDLTKNASTPTIGDDSAGGGLSKKEQRKADRKKKGKGKGLIAKTTNVPKTSSSKVTPTSGNGSTTSHGTRGIGNVFSNERIT
tara:strand:+ start:220 stop:1539 length:1320 start_codon:yes stop_codon:yes gene_type:complete